LGFSCQSCQDALQVKLESLVSSQGTLAPHLRLRDVGSRDLVALAKTAQLVGHSRPVSHRWVEELGEVLIQHPSTRRGRLKEPISFISKWKIIYHDTAIIREPYF